jgi:5-methylcytosine-specific restriction endonuclease McrA
MKYKVDFCPKCNNRHRLTKDHIVPKFYGKYFKQFDIEFNVNSKDNIQWLCQRCNMKKGYLIETQNGIDLVNEILKRAKESGRYLDNRFIQAVRKRINLTIN